MANRVPIGAVDPNVQLQLAIGLPLRNSEALTNLLRAIYDASSPQFHQYLTPAEFTEAFGPTRQDYETVSAFARANGLTILQTHPNRVLLDVVASAATVEKTFHVKMMLYQHPTEGRTFYAPDTEPSVDVSVPILDISGLSDYSPPHPLVHPSSNAQPQYGSGPGGTYLGKDFRAAYAPGVGATGVGQTVGLLEFDGYYANDITSYETQAGLPNVPLTNVLLDSYNGTPGGGNIEVALDIEMAIAMAPGLSQVIVYEAGPKGIPNDILNRMASDNLAKELSSSWSWSGSPSSTTDNIFQQLAAQGQSFFQASGDSDAYTGPDPQPCDNPYITIVGGTTLSTTGPGGSWVSEKTWNWYNLGNGTNGSSGGVSTSYAIPSWQQTVSMASNQGSGTMRNFPDVALTADSVFVKYDNGSSGAVGGTSCAAPLWAAYAALINQQALGNGKSLIGFINPAIYTLAQGGSYSSAFHDITTGNNTNNASPNQFFAAPGFDLCTGWGTPAGSGLINALAGAATPQIVSNSLALVIESCTNNAVDPGETVTMNFGLINTGSANTANLVATLQPTGGVTSPSGPQSYGVLTAGGAATTRPFTFTASGSCGGTITATLQLQDGTLNLGTITFTIQLGAVTTVGTFSETFDGVSAPSLPSGWSTAVPSGFLAGWSTTNGFSDTAPNSAFVADAGTAGQTELISPIIPIVSSAAQLTFRQNYDLAFHTISHPRSTTYYNGGVLQISIAGGAFTDILTAGGSFSVGGYNCMLATGTANPLGGAQAWGGNSAGWVTTTVVLPPSAAGQNIQLKWALGTGINTSVATGWFVDSISIQDSAFDCCVPSADVGVSQSTSPNPAAVGQSLVYTLTISNAGPSTASSLAVTDSLPSNVSFVSASPGCVSLGNTIACTIASLGAGRVSNILVTVKPSSTITLTNVVTVTSSPTDPNSANNISTSTVVVEVPPTVSSGPTNQVTTVGSTANFYVSAAGSAPLSYLWTFGGSPVSGATTSVLSLANVQANQAGNYAVVVTNAVGSVTSTVATLTVLVPPAISAQPTNQTVVAGTNTSFQVGASGTAPLNYQWMFNGSSLGGATSTSLPLNNVQTNQAGSYCVVVTNSAGSITSVVASLTVLVPPAITQQPASITTTVGSNGTFQAAASGSAALNYQWYFGNSLLSGQTATTLTLTNIQTSQAGNYQFVASNAAGAATSAVAQLAVLVPPAITTQPTNQTIAAGGNLNFVVNASGTTPLQYQWWFNATNAVGADTNTLSLANVQTNQAGAYNVVITNAAGSVTSLVANLTVGTPPSISQQPISLTVNQGQGASFNVSAGGDAPLTYQWRFNGSPAAGASSSTYALASATTANSGSYDVVVTNGYGSVTSAVAQLTVLVPPTITSQPTNQTVAAGGNGLFQVSASGTAPLNYQWWFNSTNAVGTDTNVLSVLNAQAAQAGNYCVVVTNTAGAITSSVAVLTIGVAPGISQQPSSLVVTQGQSATFNTAATGTAPLSYMWRLNGLPQNGGNGTSYTIATTTPANNGGYDVVVANTYGSVTSTVAQLTVLVPPSITMQPTNVTVAAGGSATFQALAAGSPSLSYQWWFNNTNAVGGNTNELTLSNVQTGQAGSYTLVVTNVAGAVTSAVATLTVGVPPSVTQSPTSLTIVQGQAANFTVTASGDAPLNYVWRFNTAPLGGSNATNYLISSAGPADAGSYDVVITNSFGSITSGIAQLTVLIPPTITNQPASQTVAAGSTTLFQVAASGTAPLSYQWWFNATNAVGSDTNVLVLNNAQANLSGNYTVVVTNVAGTSTSAVAQLSVVLAPAIVTQPTNQTSLVGGTVSFYAAATGSGPLVYQWNFNGNPVPGANTNTLLLSGIQATQAGPYVLVVSNSAGSTSSSTADLKVLVQPAATVSLPSPSGFSLAISSVSGLSYLLEYKNALQDPSWTPASTWYPGTGGILVLQDTNSPTGSRFYRVRCE